MTDTFLVDEYGRFVLGKSLTNHDNEALSYISSVEDAGTYWDATIADVHRRATSAVYTGTTMLNILLTQSGSRVGLLTTRGFADLPVLERGLTWLGLPYEEVARQMLHEHTPWLVHPKHIREVTERISVGSYYMGHHYMPGHIVIPMSEEDVVSGVNELLDNGVEHIGILLLGSYINPVHEVRAAELAREVVVARGLDTPVTASHEICPLSRETERLKTLLIQCYVTRVAADQLLLVEQAAKGYGYQRSLLTLLSYGAVATIHHPRLVEAVVSGPTGGLLGSKALAGALGERNLICTDLGGTTFDVGLIVDGLMPVNTEPVFANHRLRMPMVNIDSIGAGTGTVIRADPQTQRITLGPESAGSDVGTCLAYPEITIGDIDVILGYLNPDYFLGGKVKLNAQRALEMLEERLAGPLGRDVYDASSKVLDLLYSQMCDHINAILSSRGLSPSDFSLIAYGGSGPLHLWGVERGLSLGSVLTVPWAAAFSAYGVAAADYFHRYDKAVTCMITPDMPDDVKLSRGMALHEAWRELEERAYRELATEGVDKDDIYFRYGMSGCYIGQLNTWESVTNTGRVETIEDLHDVIAAFEKTYATAYPVAARFPTGHQISEVHVEAVTNRVKPVIPSYTLQGREPHSRASKGKRPAYMDGQWLQFDIWEMDLLDSGNRIDGPAIVEHPMTTLVIPPQNYIELDKHKFIWYRRQ